MLENIYLPPELESYIGSESKDFAVKAKYAAQPKVSLAMIIFGLIWFSFSLILLMLFMGPLFRGQEVQFLSNDVPTVAGPGNLRPLLLPASVIGLFVLTGILLVYAGLRMLFSKGGYYVGTPTRLIVFEKKSIRSVDWEQFSGDIAVSGNDQKGNISLGLRTGRMAGSKSGSDRYVPDKLYISGIANVLEIERICRKRIKENDPTPSSMGYSH